MPDFTHLHVHSHYSLLDGLGTVPSLLEHAGKLGMDSLALTDHGVLYGAVEFATKAKKVGIKPIVGCELYVAPRRMTDKVSGIDKQPYHLVVLCQNQTGYHNLLKLVSAAHLDGYYYKPRVDKELLQKYSEGLICLTACLQSEVSKPAGQDDPELAEKALRQYLDIFGKDRLFVELQHHPELTAQQTSNRHLIQIAKRLDLRLIATNDVHYLEYSDAEAQDALLCIQTGKLMRDQNRLTMKVQGFQDESGHRSSNQKDDGIFVDISMTATQDMIERFSDTPEAITNTQIITKMCNFEMKTGTFIFPIFPIPDKTEPGLYLRQMCIEGLWHKIAKVDPPSNDKNTIPPDIDHSYIDRFEYELNTIKETGFTSYILMVADYTNEAKRRGIFTNTRGSAAGSLVSYLIGITDIDPLTYNLIFERFLNTERVSLPDVDLDIADTRRAELIDYVSQKYGADKVAQIITFGTIAAKNSIRDVGRVLGMPYSEVDLISKLIPLGKTLSESLEMVPELDHRYATEDQVTKLINLAKRLEGVARHASVHAAGVVIADKPLIEYVPIQRMRDEENLVTQYSMYDLEEIGLVKMDFLGLANLTIIEQSLDIIKATRSIEIIPSEIPLDDAETYKLLSRGESAGVFQLESEGMRRYLKELKPTTIADIIAMVALYRPGPMELIPDYIAGKHGRKVVRYLHPKLEPILQETYGIAVYQEQIIRIAQEVCGFSYGEADVLRKAIGKKIKEMLLEQRQKWIEKGVESGISKALAEKLFDFVEPFARYGFNKAHATSYGILAYQTAYLKTHFPSQFMAAWLTSEQARDIEKVSYALQECERMNVSVLPPDVNESFTNFGVVSNDKHTAEPIRFGLGSIKNVGHAVADMIVEERKKQGPYLTLVDFIERQDQKIINRKTMESLIQAGAFDRFADRNQLLQGIDHILKYGQSLQKNTTQVGLFGDGQEFDLPPLTLPEAPKTSKEQKLQWEKELLGMYLSEHPLDKFKNSIGTISTTIASLDDQSIGKTVRVLGIVTAAKQIITKSNQAMCFAKVEDTSGAIEAVVFPSVLEQSAACWSQDRVLVIDGQVDSKDGALKILVESVSDVSAVSDMNTHQLPPLRSKPKRFNAKKSESKSAAAEGQPTKQMMHVTIPQGSTPDLLIGLKELFRTYPGDASVTLHLFQNGRLQPVSVPFGISLDGDLIRLLEEKVGHEHLRIETANER